VLAKAAYKVAKSPARRMSVQQLQSDYKAPKFPVALKHFLNSHTTQDEVVIPTESDQFEVFNQLYVANGPSMVTGHGSSWQKIRARPKVATSGCKAESPARFDTAFVWDEGHQPRDFFRFDGMYPASSTQRGCADKHFSGPYHSSPCHIQASKACWPLPASTRVCQMVHLAPSSRSRFRPVRRHPFNAQPSA